MSAAVALTEVDPTGERYEIMLYQRGWRLGGKCASGRIAACGQRIEEHGLHIWAGFYDNAFTIMRVVCTALDIRLDSLFERRNLIFYADKVPGTGRTDATGQAAWQPWPLWFQPAQDPGAFPGRDSLWATDPVMPSLATLLRRGIDAIVFGLESGWAHWPGDQAAETRAAIARMPAAQQAGRTAAPIPATAQSHHPLLELARRFGAGPESDVDRIRRTAEADVSGLLGAIHNLLKAHGGAVPAALRLRGQRIAWWRSRFAARSATARSATTAAPAPAPAPALSPSA